MSLSVTPSAGETAWTWEEEILPELLPPPPPPELMDPSVHDGKLY